MFSSSARCYVGAKSRALLLLLGAALGQSRTKTSRLGGRSCHLSAQPPRVPAPKLLFSTPTRPPVHHCVPTSPIMPPKQKQETGELMVSIEQYTKTRDSVRTHYFFSSTRRSPHRRVAMTRNSHCQRALLCHHHRWHCSPACHLDRLIHATPVWCLRPRRPLRSSQRRLRRRELTW